ncbi:hypothetical protein BGZ50_000465, partial [Haplosporangium sp. Z 11]
TSNKKKLQAPASPPSTHYINQPSARNTINMRTFFVIATIGLLSMSASMGSCASIGDALVKRSACDDAAYIDVSFDVNFDGARFATCKNVPINNWAQSSTPSDFAWCRKEWTKCSTYNPSHVSGVCNRNGVFCKAAENYCRTLGGEFSCTK